MSTPEPTHDVEPGEGASELPYVPEHVSKEIFRSALRATLALINGMQAGAARLTAEMQP